MAPWRAVLQKVGERLARQRHLLAIRDGVVGALPLVLAGSLFLLLAQPPSRALQAFVAPWAPLLLLPTRVLGGAIALYVAFSAAYSLARSYQLDAASCGLVALATYLVAAVQPGPAGQLPQLLLQRLGAGGILAALAIALGSVELTHLLVRRRWTVRLPPGTPDAVSRSLLALVPCLVSVGLVFVLVHALGVDAIRLLQQAAVPLLRGVGSLPGVVGVVLVDSVLWLLGVHAAAVGASLRPLWEAMLVENLEAAASGTALPHIAPLHFYLWFVWQGGSGAALALGLLLVRCRSAQLRSVGRLGLVPALCNVNEPLLFGVPVVLNPALAVPFIAAPLLSAVVSYAAFALDLVRRPALEVPWTLPAPLGAFLTTGGDVRAVALQVCTLALSVAVYWPFVRRYDARLLGEEALRRGGGLSPAEPSP
ncbi:MAG TPA: PTS transporter subunit EIIC [Myxococcaceae bacterium]|nr:PTS transporter subunit EIIC [Myxococcaceae bacterium]